MVSLVCLTAVLAALLANLSDAFAPQPVLPQSQRDSSGKLSMVDPAAHVDLIHSTASLLPSLSLSDAVLETAATASTAMDAVSQSGIDTPDLADAASAMPGSGGVGYSKASYYTTLGLYALSFPGIWSQVKRSTSAKVKRKTFVSDGEAASDGKDLRQQAGEIMAYMKANNYEVLEAGETITFRGLVKKSLSQALFLTFCTALGMASLALVLQIQFQDLTLPGIGSPNWFYLTLLAPYAGLYYWRSGDRLDDIKVKLLSSDDDTENEIVVEGNDDEIERMWRTLDLREKGMVKVEGILAA
mmetsp:Transcript_5511/g.15547  ORF Transcript_5511/g.15547 Transcript_5511/m.15547 type:complete len:300 (-) Transcript_5511:133-1032(-)